MEPAGSKSVSATLFALFADGEIWTHIEATFGAALLGLALGVLVGALLGIGAALLPWVRTVAQRGARVLIVEPIARRMNDWWGEWRAALNAREDEWRFAVTLPPLARELARGAGLDPQELTARSLVVATDSR